MKIAGYLTSTMLDWPGKTAVEIFLAGCNFRCGFCHSGYLLNGNADEKIRPEEFLSYLEAKKHLNMKPDGVVISGGEPTLNEDLPAYISEIKKLGYQVKLDTNGTNPRMLQELLLENLVDCVAMDIKTSFAKYVYATGVRNVDFQKVVESSVLLKESQIDYEFRTTVVPELVDEGDIQKIGEWLKGAKRYSLQQFQAENCLEENYRHLKPYPKDRLEKMVEIAKPYFGEVLLKNC
jgi:pyruvate formate lyase activating enzyme